MRVKNRVGNVVRALLVMVALVGSGYALGASRAGSPSVALAADDCQSFAETGKKVCGEFLAYWKANGGLAQQGFPVSETFSEKSETDGKTYVVQYFERAVFELHPELPEGQRVLLTLLGAQKFKTRYNGTQPSGTTMAGPPPTAAPAAMTATNRFVGENVAITFYGLRENPPTTMYQKPKDGTRCVGVDITVEGIGTKSVPYNPGYLRVQTVDDRQYRYSSGCSTLSPSLSYGDLTNGQKVRGWVTFEIPTGVMLKNVTWEGVLGGAIVTIPL